MESKTQADALAERGLPRTSTERVSSEQQQYRRRATSLRVSSQNLEVSEGVDTKAKAGILISTREVPEDEDSEAEPAFSVFSRRAKAFIVTLASIAAVSSPLAVNIYYPALGTLAEKLHVSNSSINLSITIYLIAQGLTPCFVSSISDVHGRRPLYIACFIIYLGANIGLALQSNYVALMVLRFVQSAGSSSMNSLASGVISDIVTSAERGSYMSYVQAGGIAGPTLGPIFGGLLTQFMGWRSIFWFLSIFAGITFTLFLILFPETCRFVVGNGSLQVQRWNISLLSQYQHRKRRTAGELPDLQTLQTQRKRVNLLKSLTLFFDKETGLAMLYCALLVSGFNMVLASMPSDLATTYNFNTLQIGLCYLPTALGSFTAALIAGRYLDWNFERHARRIGMEISKSRQQDLSNFPLELARLQILLPLVAFGCVTLVGYGWAMQFRTSVAGPLILLFFTSFSLCGSIQCLSTFIVDLNRSSASTATAAMFLARCWIGAGATAMVVPLKDTIGIGWTGVCASGVMVMLSPIAFVIIRFGSRWREEKRNKQQSREEEMEKRV